MIRKAIKVIFAAWVLFVACFSLWSLTWGSMAGFAVLGLPTAVIFLVYYSIRTMIASREFLGMCRNCRYDLTGNVSGVCPECGTKTEGSQ